MSHLQHQTSIKRPITSLSPENNSHLAKQFKLNEEMASKEEFKALTQDEKLDKMFDVLFELKSQQTEFLKRMETAEEDAKKTKSRVTEVEKVQDKHTDKIDFLEQEVYNNYCSILGLPEMKSADAPGVLEKLCRLCEYSINIKNDLKEIYARKDKNGGQIVLRFHDIRNKSNFMAAFKTKKPILVEQIIDLAPDSQYRAKDIYLRERLTTNNALLRKECKNFLETHFLYVWDSQGRILVKIDEDSKPIRIRSSEHLKSVVQSIKPKLPDKTPFKKPALSSSVTPTRPIIQQSRFNKNQQKSK